EFFPYSGRIGRLFPSTFQKVSDRRVGQPHRSRAVRLMRDGCSPMERAPRCSTRHASRACAPAAPRGSRMTDTSTVPPVAGPRPDERLNIVRSLPFAAVHLAPLAALVTGVTVRAVVVAVVLFYLRMFFITAGYHRYFAHRSYKMGRVVQFVMAA